MVRGLGLALLISAATLGASDARAGVLYQILYSFTGTAEDGGLPSGLVLDAQGNLYGTTRYGGNAVHGTVFKLAPDGTFTTIHQFAGGRDGAEPIGAPLTIDAHGTLYGTTIYGGVANGGTAWRLKLGKMKVLHAFGVGSDGYWPYAGLLLGDGGSLTGTTTAGGVACGGLYGCGIVFRLAADGSETVLHDFAGGTGDGWQPMGTPVRDRVGNLFGVTSLGGSENQGTIFKLTANGSESVFYNFLDDAGEPSQGLLIDRRGYLYGTTGLWNGSDLNGLFKIDSEGGLKTMEFLETGHGASLQGLIRDRSGNLYGTAMYGGGDRTTYCGGGEGCGSVFKIGRDNTQTILHGFSDTPDGLWPNGGVISDGNGNLYGTTKNGGTYGAGTIFKLTLESK